MKNIGGHSVGDIIRMQLPAYIVGCQIIKDNKIYTYLGHGVWHLVCENASGLANDNYESFDWVI